MSNAAPKYHRREFFDPTMAKHGGRIFKVLGDGFLVEFASLLIAALRHDRLDAPWVIGGPINREFFDLYAKTQLPPISAASRPRMPCR